MTSPVHTPASETLGTKPIFLAVLCSTNPKRDLPQEKSNGKRKFVWMEDSGKVSILMFCENGYYTETVIMPSVDAREYWKLHKDNGWICRVKKTDKLRGHHVRREAIRLFDEQAAIDFPNHHEDM